MPPSSTLRSGAAVVLLALSVAACGGHASDPDAARAGGNSGKGDSGADGGGVPDYTPTGPLLADIGFRPTADGFTFRNYGNEHNPTNLTPNAMRALFGDKICDNIVDGGCALTPQAEAWMQKQNEDMNGGHCQGMSMTSLLMYGHRLDAGQFGAARAGELNLDGNPGLQEMIAQQFVGQYLPELQDAQVKGTPAQIVDRLVADLKPSGPETYSLGFYKSDHTGGHAVTPYAVEDKGEGRVAILVYDNNFPGVTRHIDVDRNANTWQYETASNPNEAAAEYRGDAESATLELDPVSKQLGTHEFPYTAQIPRGSAAPMGPPVTVYLEGDPIRHGHLLITDDQGRRIGYADGKRVNEIPGARFVDTRAGTADYAIEPDYTLPANTHFVITVDGSGLTAPDRTHVGIIGDAFAVDVNDIMLAPGSRSTIDTAVDGDRVSYTSTDAQSPAIEIGENYQQAGYIFAAREVPVGPGGTATVTLPLNRNVFTIDTGASGKAGSVAVRMERIDTAGTRTFTRDAVPVTPGGSAAFDYDEWDGGGKSMGLTVSENGKATTTRLPAN
ncbi:hypothetical protein [Nocardia sp. NPDC051570]|uniref:hypothetical protein n=1 Tax=Nocardia sp. NPDC051570 TaxID=3364324 RepID=UPI0037A48DE2